MFFHAGMMLAVWSPTGAPYRKTRQGQDAFLLWCLPPPGSCREKAPSPLSGDQTSRANTLPSAGFVRQALRLVIFANLCHKLKKKATDSFHAQNRCRKRSAERFAGEPW